LERTKAQSRSSSGYLQTKEELDWGAEVAWRISRICIMQAHCWDLKFVDLVK
jgi:nitric oxide synthase oxygenase domain/subunit